MTKPIVFLFAMILAIVLMSQPAPAADPNLERWGVTPELPLRSHTERHLVFRRHVRLEPGDESRGQAACAYD